MDDFFSDLVPIKTSNGSKVEEAGGSSPFSGDSVLSALPEASAQARPASSTLADSSPVPISSPLQPMGESRQKKDARELENTVQTLLESTFKRFAGGLQNVLEDIQRRLESLEHQSEQVMKALSDVRDVGGLRDDATKERFAYIDKTLRDIQRGVQLVRDKQELLEAHAELAKLAPTALKTAETAPAEEAPKAKPAEVPAPAPQKVVCPPAQPAAVPAPAPVQVAAQELAQAPPAAPPMPSAPQQQATPFSAQTAQQALQMSSAPLIPQQVAPQYPGPQAPPPQQPQYSAPPPPVPQYSTLPSPQQQYNQAPPPMPQYSAPPEAQHLQYSQAPPPQNLLPPHPAPQYDGYSQAPNAPPQVPQYQPPSPQLPRMDSYGPPPLPPPPQAPFGAGPQMGYPSMPRPSPPNAPPPPPPPPPPGAMYGGSYVQPPPSRPSQPPPQAAPSAATTRSVPLEKVIDDVANMGFSRHEVHGVITELMDNGQSVDLNVVLDRLMNGPRR